MQRRTMSRLTLWLMAANVGIIALIIRMLMEGAHS